MRLLIDVKAKTFGLCPLSKTFQMEEVLNAKNKNIGYC